MSYRITLPESTIKKLEIDQKIFHIDSMNHLYNLIVNNYYEEFPINKKRIEKLYNVLENKVPSDKLTDTIRDIIEIDVITKRLERGLETERISLKVTKISDNTIKDLEKIVDRYSFESVNSIIREIISSYTTLTTLEKEKILFKVEINNILDAIKKRNKLEITYFEQNIIIKPYSLFTPMDDFSHYLLVDDMTNKTRRILRLSKMSNIYKNSYERFPISDETNQMIKKYQSNNLSIFTSELAKIIIKPLQKMELDGYLPYLIDDARKEEFKEHSILEDINN